MGRSFVFLFIPEVKFLTHFEVFFDSFLLGYFYANFIDFFFKSLIYINYVKFTCLHMYTW